MTENYACKHGEKRFAILAKRIGNIEPTNFFCPSKILVITTKFSVESIKEFIGGITTNQKTLLLIKQKVLFRQLKFCWSS